MKRITDYLLRVVGLDWVPPHVGGPVLCLDCFERDPGLPGIWDMVSPEDPIVSTRMVYDGVDGKDLELCSLCRCYLVTVADVWYRFNWPTWPS